MNPCVLVVDGDAAELDAVKRLLAEEWCTWDVQYAATAAEALAILERTPVDVVVADHVMSGVDGAQLLAEVRRRHRGTARLVLSGQAAGDGAFGPVVSLAHQFVRKPCRAEELRVAVGRAVQLRGQLDGESLLADVSEVDVLPSPPAVFQELLAVADSDNADAKKFAAVIERDVALSAKILQLANSAYFAPRSRVTSLEVAVVRLGVRVIRSMILTDHIQRDFVGPAAVQRWLAQLNDHAYETAQLARQLAPKAQRDDAFCAALLQECGQLVFARSRPGVFEAHLRIREERRCSLAEVELETFGFTHAQGGAYLLNLWGFPTDLANAVGAHDETPDPSQPRTVTQAVQLAHHVTEAKMHAVCGVPSPELDEEWLAYFGVEV